MKPKYFDPASKVSVLDLLVDGPSSFLSLYGELTQFHAFPPDTNLLMDHLDAHEADGHIELFVSVGGEDLVRPSLGDRSTARERYSQLISRRPDDFTTDEIGFWYFLTPVGREVWQRLTGSLSRDEPDGATWAIEEDNVRRVLVVYASTREIAAKALQRREIKPAVRLTARYSSGS